MVIITQNVHNFPTELHADATSLATSMETWPAEQSLRQKLLRYVAFI